MLSDPPSLFVDVITSYSIHYTKLYDHLLSGELNDQPGRQQALLNAVMDYSRSYRDAVRIRQEALQDSG